MNTLNRIVVKKRKPSTTENESGYRVMNSLVTCAVSNVISETVTNNNSLEVYASKCFLVMLSQEQWLQILNEKKWLMIQK